MSNRNYADELASAADRISQMSRADLQIILRRAALRLRNTSQVPLDPEWEEALQSVAAEMGMTRNDLIRDAVHEWPIANSYLPVWMIDEETETERMPDGLIADGHCRICLCDLAPVIDRLNSGRWS